MADPIEFRRVESRAPGASYNAELDRERVRLNASVEGRRPTSDLDSQDSVKRHRQLLQWYYHERDRQAENRMEMALDADFYDGFQWDPNDAAYVRDRGQMPLVYNEVAPMVDWLTGTERRNRVDWRVLPRTEDDVELADVKTKVLKFVGDINRTTFNRSQAFKDAVKVGVGWTDDGIRDDPTTDILSNRYESWRNVLWDSSGIQLDLDDARYVFRWRWVDEDIAKEMFPDRAHIITAGVVDSHYLYDEDVDDETVMRERMSSGTEVVYGTQGGVGRTVEATRRRVRLVEAQYRMPVKSQVVRDGPLRGAFFDPRDLALARAVQRTGASLSERVAMRVHVAIMTERGLLAAAPSIFRHNRYSLTPIWCYRRDRDRLPYGVIRRVRDIQQDLNKRASKALWLLNTNQIIADEGATEDWETLREEADRPDGVLIKAQGKDLQLHRDTDAATGQIQIMTMDAQAIQKTAGITQENLGRQTNATSGIAIEARQMQGAVVTTEPFDNLRLAVQLSGEKQLSLAEQFYSEEKVVRLTGARGALEWVKINAPEVQPDGSVRVINDVTASMADFVVSEQDYSATQREAMFATLSEVASKLPPEVGLRLLTIAYDYSSLPNKEQIAAQIRKITGERDDSRPVTPEEEQQAQAQAQMQAEALQIQRETALAALEEVRAKVRASNAAAAKAEAEAQALMTGDQGQLEAQLMAARDDAQREMSDEIERLTAELAQAQRDSAVETMRIKSDADVRVEVASIDAAAKRRVAEIQAESDSRIEAIQSRMEQQIKALSDKLADQAKETQAALREAELKAREKAAADKEAAAKEEKSEKEEKEPAEAPAPAAPININVHVDAGKGPVSKRIEFERDKDGNPTGAKVVESEADAPKPKE